MNERIKELAARAGVTEVQGLLCAFAYQGASKADFLEEFAELIVQECANRASWAQDTGEKDIGGEVLKHFGVEE